MGIILWGMSVVNAFVLFLFIHLIVGSIRGIYRYRMIEKYQYDYYDDHPLKLIGRVGHNLFYGTFTLPAFYISVSLTTVALFVLSLS
ncbi:MAG: hypothetical protein DHS20C17_16770 [Cyclobacteriaceae bacterium]|nr:MAG: hypothetical protein DHS20C17_16770 [Cyclobacteriaceae bacterium]